MKPLFNDAASMGTTGDPVPAEEFLLSHGIDFERQADGTLVHEGSIDLSGHNLARLPDLSNLIVNGDFSISDNQLTTLEGAPRFVRGSFNCRNNHLATLEGAPREVGGEFSCANNALTTLKGGPQHVGYLFCCSNNRLTSLEGAPLTVDGCFVCDRNELTSLEGAPQSLRGGFYCDGNRLSSLAGAPQAVDGFFSCTGNRLATLAGAPQKFALIDSDFGQFITWDAVPEYLRAAAINDAVAEAASRPRCRSRSGCRGGKDAPAQTPPKT